MKEIFNPEFEDQKPPEEEEIQDDFEIGEEIEKTETDFLIEQRNLLQKETEEYIKSDKYHEDGMELSKASEDKLNLPFQKMMHRIFDETHALEEIQDTIGKDNLLRGFAEAEFPTDVQFGKAEEFYEEAMERSKTTGRAAVVAGGSFNFKTKEIKISEDIPNRRTMWDHITFNYIPDVIKLVDHELTHFYQDKAEVFLAASLEQTKKRVKDMVKTKSFYELIELARQENPDLIDFDIKDKVAKQLSKQSKQRVKDIQYEMKYRKEKDFSEEALLSEVIAKKAGSVYEKDLYNTTEIISALTNNLASYGYKDPQDIDRITLASQAINRFRALGFSDKEIAEEFAGVTYDSESVSFPIIEERLEKLVKEKDITIEDLDDKADLRHIEQDIHMYQATKIAQEELSDFAEDQRQNKENDEFV